MKDLTNNIRALRILKGFSQADIARMLGITQSNYARMEKSGVSLTENKLAGIAEAFDVSVGFIEQFHPDRLVNIRTVNSNGTITLTLSRELKMQYEQRLTELDKTIIKLKLEKRMLEERSKRHLRKLQHQHSA